MTYHKEDNKLSLNTSKSVKLNDSKSSAKTGKQLERIKTPNFVAKHARTFNSFSVHVDKKKRSKKGYQKHKADY